MSYDIGLATGLSNPQISDAIKKSHDMPSAAAINELVNGSLDYGTAVTFIGDSLTEGESGSAAFSRVYGVLAGCKGAASVKLGYNQGVGGDTSQDVINRLETVGANMQDIADLMIGTNDVTSNVTLDAYINNVMTIINSCFDYGAKVVVVHSVPLKDASAEFPWDASQNALRQEYNDWLSTLSVNNVIVDSTSVDLIIDPSTMYVDGTHLNYYGSMVFGGAQAEYLLRAFRQVISMEGYLTDKNILANAQLSGSSGSTGGITSGDVASSWSTAGNVTGGATAIMTKTDDVFSIGSTAQTVTIAGASSSTGKIVNLKQTVTYPAALASDNHMAMCRFKIESGHEGIVNIGIKVGSYLATVNFNKQSEAWTSNDEFKGVLVAAQQSAFAGGETTATMEITIKVVSNPVDAVIHFDKPIYEILTS